MHAHSEIERKLRAQLEAARAEVDYANRKAVDTPPVFSADMACEKSCNMCDAACDPVRCEAEECEIRLSADEELSTDATELAAEVCTLKHTQPFFLELRFIMKVPFA